MTTHRTSYFVIVALTLSLLLHMIIAVPVLWDGELTWQAITDALREKISQILHPETPDQVLARKKAKAVPRVSLKLGPEAPHNLNHSPQTITVRLIQDRPVVAIQPLAIKPQTTKTQISKTSEAHEIAKKAQANNDLYDQLMAAPNSQAPAVPTDDSVNSTIMAPLDSEDDTDRSYSLKNSLIDDSTVHIDAAAQPLKPPTAKTPIPADAPPPFPVEIQATYRTSAYGFGINVSREWRMEGRHYNITDQASAFGFHVVAQSDGRLSEQGLEPDSFQILLNNSIYRFAKFDRQSMTMTYGRSSNPHTMPFNTSIQDISSLGFQMALAFGDKAQDIQLTMGTGIYTLHLELTDEELLKLPVGKVRTVRIHGESTKGNSIVTADVWLAPDYQNMPVKVRVTRDGDKLEQSLSSLSVEGKVIFGKKRQAPAEEQTKPNGFNQPNNSEPQIPDALKNKEEF